MGSNPEEKEKEKEPVAVASPAPAVGEVDGTLEAGRSLPNCVSPPLPTPPPTCPLSSQHRVDGGGGSIGEFRAASLSGETSGVPVPRRRAGKEALKHDLDTEGTPPTAEHELSLLSAMTLDLNKLEHEDKLEGGKKSTHHDRSLLAAAGTWSHEQPVLPGQMFSIVDVEQAMKNVLIDLKDILSLANLPADEKELQRQESIKRMRLLDCGAGGALQMAIAPAMAYTGAIATHRATSRAGRNHKKDKTKAMAKTRAQELHASKGANVQALKGIKVIILEACNFLSSLTVNAQSNSHLLVRDYFAALVNLRERNKFFQTMVCRSPEKDQALKNAALLHDPKVDIS